VQYFDKSRMEINQPGAHPDSEWFVTNGLLVNELVSGQVQVGDVAFMPLVPAVVPIAGDADGIFPAYRDLARLANQPAGRRAGDRVTTVFQRDALADFPWRAADPAVEIVAVERGFGIPRAFWEFMHQRGVVLVDGELRTDRLVNWIYVLGLPTTDAYWTKVRVGGRVQEVMFQAFERRVLTYTPDNPAPWRVEMGNVGRYYHHWRYTLPFAGGERALITAPEPGAVVGSPLLVQGFENGTAFEAAVTVRLRAKPSGALLATTPTTVQRPEVAVPGPFAATLTFTVPAGVTEGTIEVVTFSPADGMPTVLATQAVRLAFPAGKRALMLRPMADTFVASPLTVQGYENGTAFEAAVTVRLRDLATGRVLAATPTTVQRPDIGRPGPFRAVLTFTAPTQPAPGVVEVVTVSPADGTPTVLDSVPVRLLAAFAGGRTARITVPSAGASVASPLVVRGMENGTAFEASILVRLRHRETGAALATTPTMVRRPDIGQVGPFEATLTFAAPARDTPGLIEVVTISPADGSETVSDSLPVTIRRAG
jgi:hypothetical protein